MPSLRLRQLLKWALPALLSLLPGCSGAAAEHLTVPEVPSPPPPKPAASSKPTGAVRSVPTAGLAPPITTAAPALPVALPGPLLPSDIRFGSGGPLAVFAANAHPTWVGICQARIDNDASGVLEVHSGAHGELEGDRMNALLVDSQGKETPLDNYLGASPDGRYLAFTQNGHLWLRNAETLSQNSLSEWQPNKLSSRGNGAWPPASFDPKGRYFAYLTLDGTDEVVVLRDLIQGTERRIEPGAGKVWNLDFEPDGELLRLEVLSKDNNGNGRLEGPLYPGPNPACQGPVSHYSVRRVQGDTPSTRLYELSTRALREAPGFVATFGNRAITRGPDRELWLEAASGARSALSAPSCNGRILHLDATMDVIILGCAKASGERRGLYWRHADKMLELKLDVAAFETDTRWPGAPLWLPISAREDNVLVNLATGAVQKLAPELQWLTSFQHASLAERGGAIFVISGSPGKPALEQDTAHKRPTLANLQTNARYVALGKDLYDLSVGAFVGAFGDVPLWLSPEGEGLLATTAPHTPKLARGPLHWERALAPAPRAP